MPVSTKMAITRSFLRLLHEKPIDKITVRDIVEDCGITRNTFYYHYPDIYAIVEETVEENFRMAAEHIRRIGSWSDGFAVMFTEASRNRRAFSHLISSASCDRILRCLSATVQELAEEFVSDCCSGADIFPERQRAAAQLCTSAVLGKMLGWVIEGMPPLSEESVRPFAVLLEESVRAALQGEN